jgi:hypothetical protein
MSMSLADLGTSLANGFQLRHCPEHGLTSASPDPLEHIPGYDPLDWCSQGGPGGHTTLRSGWEPFTPDDLVNAEAAAQVAVVLMGQADQRRAAPARRIDGVPGSAPR